MRRPYNLMVRDQAFHLYCQDIPIKLICDTLLIKGQNTLYRWIREQDWEKKKAKLTKVTREYGKDDITKINEALFKSIKTVWVQMVQNNEAKVAARDVLETIKMERLILGESTENINFDVNNAFRDALNEYNARKRKESIPANVG